MDNDEFIKKCKIFIAEHLFMNVNDISVYVVWYCKTLCNKKAMLASTFVNGLYFEITYNGLTGQYNIDVYSKTKNYVKTD